MSLVIMLVAGLAQAASINWSVVNVYGPDGATKPATSTYTAYLFVTANSTGVSTDINVVSKSDVMSVLAAGDLTGLSSYASITKVNNSAGIWGGATGLAGADANKFASGSLSAFVVIIDSTSPAEAKNYLLVSGGDEKTVKFNGSVGAQTLGFLDQTTYTQGVNNTWQAVPEPTSGLLLLLGMGVLALRRKQK